MDAVYNASENYFELRDEAGKKITEDDYFRLYSDSHVGVLKNKASVALQAPPKGLPAYILSRYQQDILYTLIMGNN